MHALTGLQIDRDNGIIRGGLAGCVDRMIERLMQSDLTIVTPTLRLINILAETMTTLEQDSAVQKDIEGWQKETDAAGINRYIMVYSFFLVPKIRRIC